MIIYVTKQTAERYKLDLSEKTSSPLKEFAKAVIGSEGGDKMLEWGAKLFYFDRRKCLEVANFASKFTLFLIDIKIDAFPNIGNLMAYYLYDIYQDDPEATDLLDRYFREASICIFSRLKDKSNIAHLNHALGDFALDGYRLYDFIEDGILHTKEFNRLYNKEYPVTRMIDGKKEYDFTANVFKELLQARYLKTQ